MLSVDERATALLQYLAAASTVRIRANVSMRAYTTFGIGGPALLLAEPVNDDELVSVIRGSADVDLPVVSVGQGSNLLVADTGVAAVVVVLGGEFVAITRDSQDPLLVIAGGGVKLPVLARQTVAMGLSGLEWAVGVPGSVGGGVRMNAGGHGSDMAANVTSATIIRSETDAVPTVVQAMDLGFGYRTSLIAQSDIVLRATFRLTPGVASEGEQELREIVRWRREHQPGGANCGSVFTNPAGDSAGRLIDSAGLKGHRIGSARVSEKHANFIQADPNASADDVSALIVYVQTVIRERFDVELHAEVKTLGISSYRREA